VYQTPQPIWNEIAATQELRTPLWRAMFRLSPEELSGSMESLEANLESKGADVRVTRAYLLVAPLLAENLAISRYIEASGRDSLRSSMPEIETVNEATILASQEFSLKPSQQAKLQELLRADLTTPPSAPASAPPTA
jgi:hypothetical protein